MAPPETPPAPLSAGAAWGAGGYLVLSGPRGAHADSSAEGAAGALGPGEASGRRNCLCGCPRRLKPGCSAARSGRSLRLSGAGRRCSPSCRCHQPAEAGSRQGAEPELPRSLQRRESRAGRTPRRQPAGKASKVVVRARGVCAPLPCPRRLAGGLRRARFPDPELGDKRGSRRGGVLLLDPAAAQDQVLSRRIPAAIALPI